MEVKTSKASKEEILKDKSYIATAQILVTYIRLRLRHLSMHPSVGSI